MLTPESTYLTEYGISWTSSDLSHKTSSTPTVGSQVLKIGRLICYPNQDTLESDKKNIFIIIPEAQTQTRDPKVHGFLRKMWMPE